jgi:hypothetical protein
MRRSQKKAMKKIEKIDRLIIEALNVSVSVMGSLLLTQNGFWEGFSAPKTIGATVFTAVIFFRALKDAQHGLRKGARNGKTVDGDRGEFGKKGKKNIVQGTPWTEIRFNQYREVDRDTRDNAAAL